MSSINEWLSILRINGDTRQGTQEGNLAVVRVMVTGEDVNFVVAVIKVHMPEKASSFEKNASTQSTISLRNYETYRVILSSAKSHKLFSSKCTSKKKHNSKM